MTVVALQRIPFVPIIANQGYPAAILCAHQQKSTNRVFSRMHVRERNVVAFASPALLCGLTSFRRLSE